VLDPAVVERYTEIVSSPARWQEADDRYGFRTVVLGNFSKTVRSPLGQTLLRDPRWHLAYLDPLAVIFVKDDLAAQPAVQLDLPTPQGRRVPFVAPASFVSPLPLLQRTFLHDFPANYLIEYLADVGQLGRPGDVIELATQALQSMPEHALLYRQRCAAHLALGAVPAALEDCAAAYRRSPGDPQVVALYSVALNGAGRRQEALFLLGKALEENPRDETLNRVRMSLR
jgi:tetratricopeptide (TPR) repeat protein